MIHICYGLHDKTGRYSKFVGTSIISIFENTTADVTVHILHDNTLTPDNRDKFIYIAGRYGQQIKFYNVDQIAAKEIENFRKNMSQILTSRYTIATLYRILLPHIMEKNIGKIIYIDADTIINLDIKEIWNINLENKPLAAVSESSMGLTFDGINVYLLHANLVKYENYFNAGFLILNLNYLRENYSTIQNGYNKMCAFVNEGKHVSWDQDILNYCFSNDYIKLPTRFNKFVTHARISKSLIPAIYHYVMQSLKLDTKDIFNRLYFKYFTKTPWFNEDMFGNISAEILNMHNQHKLDLISLTKLMAGKCRAFFTESQNAEFVKNIFAVTPEEEFLITPPRAMT